MSKTEDIRKRWEAMPYLCVPGEQAEDRGSNAWRLLPPELSDDRRWYTVSPNPIMEGWNTDSRYPGYGLPEPVAEILAGAKRDIEYLLKQLDAE